jgi:very-short-patch-repair endonuclease
MVEETMINNIYINEVKLDRREKRIGWVYILENGIEYKTADLPKCKVECHECGNLSREINFNPKKFATKEYVCSTCCKLGERNPFYGKSHDREMIEATKVKLKKIGEDKWKDPEYRENVIKGTSKPRREGFKAEQSARVTQWYKDHPEQRQIRSKQMQKSWEDGLIEPNDQSKYNRSKGELELFDFIKNSFPDNNVNSDGIMIDGKHFLPDICIDNRVIIEYYGNFWHGNPAMYEESDEVGHKSTAGEIWEKDNKRVDLLTNAGYSVFIVWEKDYLSDKEETCKLLLENIRML